MDKWPQIRRYYLPKIKSSIKLLIIKRFDLTSPFKLSSKPFANATFFILSNVSIRNLKMGKDGGQMID
ncbi:MAG: hypothetical protein IPM92_16325 [Saprospiraceae bacterium]|nr:hypothetical protein [Saprospiraceae bacterium]